MTEKTDVVIRTPRREMRHGDLIDLEQHAADVTWRRNTREGALVDVADRAEVIAELKAINGPYTYFCRYASPAA